MKYVLMILIIILIYLTGCSTPREVRNYVVFMEDKPLEWSDFKAIPDERTKQGSYVDIGWVVSERMNIWWGKKYLEVHGIMFPDKSWVKPEHKTKNYLEYYRTYHKIAELYARKIYVFLETNDVKTNELDNYIDIKDSIDSQFSDRIKQFEVETNFGQDSTELKYWIDMINREFINYPTNGSNKLYKF